LEEDEISEENTFEVEAVLDSGNVDGQVRLSRSLPCTCCGSFFLYFYNNNRMVIFSSLCVEKIFDQMALLPH